MSGSHEDTKARRKDKEELSEIVVDCAFHLHQELGPGLLESVYEVVLAKMLEQRGLAVKRQVPIPIAIMDLKFDEGFRADIMVEDLLLLELKSIETLGPLHQSKILKNFVPSCETLLASASSTQFQNHTTPIPPPK